MITEFHIIISNYLICLPGTDEKRKLKKKLEKSFDSLIVRKREKMFLTFVITGI